MLAIVAALKEEVADYLALLGYRRAGQDGLARFYRTPARHDVVVVVSGIGRARAVEATTRAVEIFGPDLILAVGFAGGVRPGLKAGDVVLCDRVWSVEGPPDSWTPELAQSRSVNGGTLLNNLSARLEASVPRYDRGECLSVPQIVSSGSDKARIGELFPVNIIDMESFWVAETAARHGIPYTAVRSVLDPLEQSLPAFVGKVAANGGTGTHLRALRYALQRPTEIPGLVRMAVQAKAAKASLASFLRAFVSQELPHPVS